MAEVYAMTPPSGQRRPLPPANELAALIQRRLEELGTEGKPLSFRSAATQSQGDVSHFHLSQLARGKASPEAMSDQTVRGVAKSIRVDVEDVYAAAKVPRPRSRWELPARFDRVPEPKRRIVESLIESMLSGYEQGLSGKPWT